MKKLMSGLVLRRCVLLAATAALAACAALDTASPEDRVKLRAQARWSALIKGDFDAAYAFLSPGSRALTTPAQYRARFGGAVMWKRVDVVKVDCESSEKCIARVRVEHEPLPLRGRLGTIESHVDESWLLDGGQWWHVQSL